MKQVVALLILPLVLFASGSMIDGYVAPTATNLVDNPTVIHLPCGIDLDTRSGESGSSASLMISGEQQGRGTYLVQFDGPVYSHERNGLEVEGVSIEGYLPNYTYIIRTDETRISEISSLPGVHWVGDYQPGYKICPELNLDEEAPRTLSVTLYAGTSGEVIHQAVEELGGELLGWQAAENNTFARIMLSADKVTSLAHHPEIKWIEPFYQPYLYNGQCQWIIQTWENDNRRIWDEGVTGDGQIVASLDSGIRTTHNFYRDESVTINDFGDFPTHRKIIAYQKPAYDPDGIITFGDENGHGTHTAGSMAGNDQPVGGSSVNIGMAPDARIYFLDGGAGGSGIIHAVSLEYSLSIPYNGNSAGGARLMSNSWGSQTTRAYDQSCMEADQTMWNRPTYLVMFSGGNTDGSPNTGSPGNAKNVMSVGGCNNGALANIPWGGSSVGPSGDGRIRPDIVTPGHNVTSAYATGDANEVSWSGTSMACPVAVGNAALIRQYLADGFYPDGVSGSFDDAFEPSGAMVKAMMINSVETDFSVNPVPDIAVGWGRPKLDNVLYFPGDARKLAVVDFSDGLETGYKFVGTVDVSGDGEPFRATLNWTDFPGQQYASPALVNDLNLEVVSPTGTSYRGNNFTDNLSVTGGDWDERNPTENVFVAAPQTGEWKLYVHANNVPDGPQPFALVVTGELGTLISSASINDIYIDDDGGVDPNGNLDPGENVTMYVFLENAGDEGLTNVSAVLSSASSDVTITGSTASYGNIAAGEVKQGDGFAVSVSSSAVLETMVDFDLEITSSEINGSLGGFELMIGTPTFTDIEHDVGNILVTVTQHGSIGYLGVNETGKGIRYPTTNPISWLYHGSFAAGNSASYLCDRMFGDDQNQTNGKDWEVSSDPDGMVIIGRRQYSDQDSRAIFTDAGHSSPNGLQAYQYGYAFGGKDFIILKYVLENTGSSDLTGMYAGIMCDLDMGTSAVENTGGTNQSMNLAYMKQSATDHPHLALKILRGTKANVSMISNPDYVWDAWNDDNFYRFLSGDLSFPSPANDTDYSIIVSVGPFNLTAGAIDTFAFGIIGGTDLTDLEAKANDCQETWNNMDFFAVEEENFVPSIVDLAVDPAMMTGSGSIHFSLPVATHTRLAIYDISGRLVRLLVNDQLSTGIHEIYWDGHDQQGLGTPNGVYFFSLTTTDDRVVRKAVIIK